MSGYRFCRTDDIGLLVDALNRCGQDPPMTPAAFKRSIRDLQVWCSSCMVAFAGADPIGVLIGAKRPSATLIHWIAVHPDHQRQGHGRHLLESLGSKLAILGPPRIVAEVPEAFEAACGLFSACGYVEEASLTDYVWGRGSSDSGACPERAPQGTSRWVIPVTVDDLSANGLLDPPSPSASAGQVLPSHSPSAGQGPASAGEVPPPVCWERSAETLVARKGEIVGLAVATDEGIEAYLLYRPLDGGGEVAALRSLIDDGGERLAHLLSPARARGLERAWFPKVHPAEVPAAWLEALGFRPAGAHRLFAGIARPG
jgi:GNAT superfamily N-acetyltransferase